MLCGDSGGESRPLILHAEQCSFDDESGGLFILSIVQSAITNLSTGEHVHVDGELILLGWSCCERIGWFLCPDISGQQEDGCREECSHVQKGFMIQL